MFTESLVPDGGRIVPLPASSTRCRSAAAIAERFLADGSAASEEERPQTWGADDGSPRELIHFAATFFDAYLEARLDEALSVEFSLLCATAYYLSDSVGSAAVVIRNLQAPDLELGQGLARVAHAILRNDFAPIDGEFPHKAFSDNLLAELDTYFFGYRVMVLG